MSSKKILTLITLGLLALGGILILVDPSMHNAGSVGAMLLVLAFFPFIGLLIALVLSSKNE